MRDKFDFIALETIKAPGTAGMPAYFRGDGVPASTVENWSLVVGEQVMPLNTGAVARPDDDGDRAAWEAYAIGQGMTVDEAREASLKELRSVPPPDDQVPPEDLPNPVSPERPDENAAKAEWVAWARANGADEDWAGAKSTTKADLIAFDPSAPHGDVVAEAADEQTNG